MESEKMPPTGISNSQFSTFGKIDLNNAQIIEGQFPFGAETVRAQSRSEKPTLRQAVVQGRMLSQTEIEVIVVLKEVNRAIALDEFSGTNRLTTT
jgi:hypothetical protein